MEVDDEIDEQFIMSNDSVVLFCEQLKLSVGELDPNRASRYLDAIGQLFRDTVSESESGKHLARLLSLVDFSAFIYLNPL